MTTEASEPAPETPPQDGPIVAKAGTWYRMARYIMFLVLVGYGAASIYDGFYSWPKWGITIHTEQRPKSEMDIMFNRVMGVILPPFGIFILIRTIMNSRGKYRLEDGIVYVPGHPPVPLENIQAVDRELWDRKGIAYVDYDLGNGQAGRFRLDDFVYEREPVDQIFAAIEATVLRDHPAPVMAAEAEAKAAEPKPAPVVKAPAPVVKTPGPVAAPMARPAVKPASAPAQPAVAPAKPMVPKPAGPAVGAPKAPPATAPLPRPKFAPGPRTGLPPKFPPPRPPQGGV